MADWDERVKQVGGQATAAMGPEPFPMPWLPMQIAKELAQKKVASGAGEAETVEHMKQVHDSLPI